MSNYLPPLVSFQLQGLLCKPHFNSSFIPANTVSNSKQNAICIHDCAIYFFKSSLILASEVRKTPTCKICLTLLHFSISIIKQQFFNAFWNKYRAQCVKKIFMGHVNLSPRHNLVYCSAAVYYYTLHMNHIEKSTIRKSDSLEFSQ